jgi:hypothetical protein
MYVFHSREKQHTSEKTAVYIHSIWKVYEEIYASQAFSVQYLGEDMEWYGTSRL